MQYSVDNSKIKNPDKSYAEAGQLRPCLFAFAQVDDSKVYPLFRPVKCRDYLGDFLVWSHHPDLKSTCYGFDVFDKGYDFTKPVLLMYDAAELHTNIALLNKYEQRLGIPLTTIAEVKNDKATVVVFPDKWWMTNTLHLSWYTQTLRHLTYPLKDLTSVVRENMIKVYHDTNELKFFNFPKVLQKLHFKQVSSITPEKLKGNPYTIHNSSGFYAILSQVAIFLKMEPTARKTGLTTTTFTYLKDILDNVDTLRGEI